MSFRYPVLAVLFGCLATPLAAQGLQPPKELPPDGYKGDQFVDSAGCVFLRGDVGDRVTWVARISRDRRQMCGLAPSIAPAVAAASPEEATLPERSALAREPQHAVLAGSRPPHRSAPKVGRAAASPDLDVQVATVVCPARAPVARRFSVKGGTKVLCAPEDAAFEDAIIPRGYRAAWADDRLNPLRGLGTAEGEAMQERVWTRKVPARLVAQVDPAKVEAPPPTGMSARKASATTLSTSSASAQSAGRHLVQVGSFGVSANAQRTRERLAALGLPVMAGTGSINGRPVQVVYAGPFPGAEAAQAALLAIRRAGFGDAFVK